MSTITRRNFLTAAAVGASMLTLSGKRVFAEDTANAATARYRRYNVTSPEGQRMLQSYARGVAAMLALPATHPQNWFRNAFIHMMDCPHGNWWFYVWHRAYIGYFEETIRNLSGDPSFALPYWDWTQLPEIPAGMFDGVLTPTDSAYEPYTGNLARFTSFIQPALQSYWGTMNGFQRAQQRARGYDTFDKLWNDVTGFSPSANAGISGNMAYAITCGARYLSRDNPKLDDKTAYDVSPAVIRSGLQPTRFYDADIANSFASSRTTSHVIQPDGSTHFSILEGMPHNKVHNYIGGVGPISPGPFGNMTNFLSPVDPIFFLHHANMDRLWDVWTRKQLAYGLPTLPTGADWSAFSSDMFLFYVNGKGEYVSGAAGDYVNMSRFDYDYQPGTGLDTSGPRVAHGPIGLRGTLNATGGSVAMPTELIRSYLDDAQQAAPIASITLPRPDGDSIDREFDVLVNAPAGVSRVDASSPYYAGTVAFFGPTMHGMKMAHDATFALPLPKALGAFSNLVGSSAGAVQTLNVRVVPSGVAGGKPLPLRGLSVKLPAQ